MTTPPPEGDLPEEFRRLGENLKNAARAALESEESRKLQREIKAGLATLGASLNGVAREVKSGETTQLFKSEVDDFSQRVRSGQVESQIRKEMLAALRSINNELQKMAHSGEAPKS